MMGIALIMLMAGFIKICSVHTPSSNPKLPPPKPLPGESRESQRKIMIPKKMFLTAFKALSTELSFLN